MLATSFWFSRQHFCCLWAANTPDLVHYEVIAVQVHGYDRSIQAQDVQLRWNDRALALHPFRRIWLGSPLSNLGILVQGVGAAWAMTQMSSSADTVALVQNALMLPVMLISMPAGAITDMRDRRIVAIASLRIALAGASVLTALSWLSLITLNALLALCFTVGSGMALMGPAWRPP